jgi:hypothetical protein
MVSITVTMIMMLVISLIVIGVAQVSRHNQQEALDRQLSSQAFYAAESGVNDAVKYLQDNLSSLPGKNTDCGSFISNASLNPQLSDGVKYTCLMVDPEPDTLTVSPLPVAKSTVLPLKSSSGAWVSLVFTWSNNAAVAATKSGNCPAAGVFPKVGDWPCSYGVLRLDMLNTGTIDQASGVDSSKVATYYFAPLSSGGSTTTSFAPGPHLVGVKCDNSAKNCSIKMNGLNPSGSYYARLTMLYQDSDLITIASDPSSKHFVGGQAVIDSTGRAQDVLRRIQVRVPLTGSADNSPLPLNALQTTSSLCKYFTIAPGGTANYSADGSAACNYGL